VNGAVRFVCAAADAPAGPGAYALLVELKEPLRVAYAAREATLAAGRYIYCGSACGPGGIAARLRRHMRPDKRPHWHIDALTMQGAVLGAWVAPGGDECALNEALSALPMPAPGFGATDCRRCGSHLRFWAAGAAIAEGWDRSPGATPEMVDRADARS
jgi:Uri superfamily endonuclease